MISKLKTRVRRKAKTSDFAWRYMLNLGSTLSHRLHHRPAVAGEAARVLADLDRNGIAITSAQALWGDGPTIFDEACEAAEALERDRAAEIAAAKAALEGYDGAFGEKTFLFEHLPGDAMFDTASPFARFALHAPIPLIADAYFGMATQMNYCNVWHNLTTQAEARQSQLWHRDPEDRLILKVFACLRDVDEGSGPFTYAAGSHPKVRLPREPESFIEPDGGQRSHDEQMAAVVPPERWIKGIGPKGTIIFADTRGYHKGGLARAHDRLMYVCRFTSPASGLSGVASGQPAHQNGSARR